MESPTPQPAPGSATFMEGCKDSLPIVISYIPVAFAFGLNATRLGFSPLESVFFSCIIYAGASQFVITAMLAAGSSLWIAALTVMAMDVRHVLYGPSLRSRIIQRLQKSKTALWAFGLTDEVFAAATAKLVRNNRRWSENWMIGIAFSSWSSWVFGTVIGAFSGSGLLQGYPAVEAAEDQPAVQQAATEVRNAWLALERTRIVSPMTGYVSRRAVQPGAQISPTTPLMAVVPATNMWVDANFKETQIANMRIGQPVTITTDIYGDDVKYTGKVVGLDMGTGSAFSLLPAQNATGNWIKVVQRLPVRIELDQKQLEQYPLRIGLSTLVSVNTTNRDGQVLANKVRSTPVAVSTAREISLAPVNKLIDDIVKANAG